MNKPDNPIRDRIKELRRVRASELIFHQKNFRTHPERQRAALRGILGEIGYADALLARETPEGLALIRRPPAGRGHGLLPSTSHQLKGRRKVKDITGPKERIRFHIHRRRCGRFVHIVMAKPSWRPYDLAMVFSKRSSDMSEPAELVFDGDDAAGLPRDSDAPDVIEHGHEGQEIANVLENAAFLASRGFGLGPAVAFPWQHNAPWDDGDEMFATTSAATGVAPRGAFNLALWSVSPPGSVPSKKGGAGPLTRAQKRWVKKLREAKKALEKLLVGLNRMKEKIENPPAGPPITALQSGQAFKKRELLAAIAKANRLRVRVNIQLADPPRTFGKAADGSEFFPPTLVLLADIHVAESSHMSNPR